MDLRPSPQSFKGRATVDGGDGRFRLQDAYEARHTGFQGDMGMSSLNLSPNLHTLKLNIPCLLDGVEARYTLVQPAGSSPPFRCKRPSELPAASCTRTRELPVRLIRGKSCRSQRHVGQDFPRGVLATILIELYKIKLIQEVKFMPQINLIKLCGFKAWR